MSTLETRPAAPGGVIHDIGYQRYSGPRLGRRHVVGSLYLHGLRTSFGLGRSAKAKIFPWMIVSIMTVVAAVLTAVRAQFGEVILTYTAFAGSMSWLLIFFVAVLAPELVSRDLHSGVLPLYFSRPLRRSDYALAKLAALASAVWLLLGGPQLLMFAGGAFTTKTGMRGVWDEFTDLVPGLLYAGMWAVLFASISLLVASLTGKRAFAAGGIVAVFLMTTPIVGVLSVMPSRIVNELAFLASPSTLVQSVGSWLFPEAGAAMGIGDTGPVYLAALVLLVAGCVTLLLARYRKVAAK
ncbi:ABC transporter permease [Micromonospora polyrhachis]|uniref:ABC-2 type transport system permease protein n=1 Tax=Micromonospora polyrhachis TaxID=1282883 RepID=A0A7W7SNX1_9ACTN|nr:ABC-2 type transport system permease protein [Micromonospora polyrhachis]